MLALLHLWFFTCDDKPEQHALEVVCLMKQVVHCNLNLVLIYTQADLP